MSLTSPKAGERIGPESALQWESHITYASSQLAIPSSLSSPQAPAYNSLLHVPVIEEMFLKEKHSEIIFFNKVLKEQNVKKVLLIFACILLQVLIALVIKQVFLHCSCYSSRSL